MVVLLNRKACEGNAGEKWDKINSKVHNLIGNYKVIECDEKTDTNLESELVNGENSFIAAGGDGTVNYLINLLAKKNNLTRLRKIKIGAIGLGSSNDFHKPFAKEKSITGIPVRIVFNKTIYQDLGKIEWKGEEGALNDSYWINNSSIGITAEANYFFNNPNQTLSALKKLNTDLAIFYAAVRTILRNKKIALSLDEGVTQEKVIVSNLGIVKNPNFSGSLCYDSPYLRNDGQLYLHVMYGMNKANALRMLYNLSKKRFMGIEGTRSFMANNICVSSENSFALEYDGEVIKTKSVRFSLINNGVQLCV